MTDAEFWMSNNNAVRIAGHNSNRIRHALVLLQRTRFGLKVDERGSETRSSGLEGHAGSSARLEKHRAHHPALFNISDFSDESDVLQTPSF